MNISLSWCLSGLLCVRCPGLQWSSGGEDQPISGQNKIQPISQDEQFQVYKVKDVSEYFWGKIFRFTTSISRERKITKTSLLNHERIELAQMVEQRNNK